MTVFTRWPLPLKVEWPDGSRAAVLFLAEEENEPGTFSIHQMRRYCAHKLEAYAQVREGLMEFEPDPKKRMKYSELIDIYADLGENDVILYKEKYGELR